MVNIFDSANFWSLKSMFSLDRVLAVLGWLRRCPGGWPALSIALAPSSLPCAVASSWASSSGLDLAFV